MQKNFETIYLGKVPVDKIRIAFDLSTLRVGCALLQATLGGDPSVCQRVDPKHWELSPTPDLKVYEVTPEQFGQLIGKMEEVR